MLCMVSRRDHIYLGQNGDFVLYPLHWTAILKTEKGMTEGGRGGRGGRGGAVELNCGLASCLGHDLFPPYRDCEAYFPIIMSPNLYIM